MIPTRVVEVQCREEVQRPHALIQALLNRIRNDASFPATVWESRQQYAYYRATYLRIMRVENYDDLTTIQKHIFDQVIYKKKESDVRRLTAEGVRRLYMPKPTSQNLQPKENPKNQAPDEDEEFVDR